MEEQKIIAKILKKSLEERDLRQSLVDMKLRPTYENGILLQMVRKAAGGDLTAAKYILGAVAPETEAVGPDLRNVPTETLRRLAAAKEAFPKEVKQCT